MRPRQWRWHIHSNPTSQEWLLRKNRRQSDRRGQVGHDTDLDRYLQQCSADVFYTRTGKIDARSQAFYTRFRDLIPTLPAALLRTIAYSTLLTCPFAANYLEMF